jgi:hypothetical protein
MARETSRVPAKNPSISPFIEEPVFAQRLCDSFIGRFSFSIPSFRRPRSSRPLARQP